MCGRGLVGVGCVWGVVVGLGWWLCVVGGVFCGCELGICGCCGVCVDLSESAQRAARTILLLYPFLGPTVVLVGLVVVWLLAVS